MITKRYLLVLMLTCLIGKSVYSKPDTLWTKTFGGIENDRFYSIQQTTDGGYICLGYKTSYGEGGNDVWLIKTNEFGDTLWTKTYGGSKEDYGFSVQQTTDEGYVITGWTESFGSGGYDVWLLKTDEFGDTLWTKTYGGSGDDKGSSVQQTADEGYIITGYTNSYGAGKDDYWLIKTSGSGDTLWTKTYGGTEDDRSKSVQQTTDEGYIITGYTNSFGAGGWDLWLVKTNESGDTLWTKTIGGSEQDIASFVRQTTDQNYILIGHTNSYGDGKRDIWLIRIDESGNILWTTTYGGNENEYGYSVRQTTDSGYILSGYSQSYGSGGNDVWLIKTDEFGDTLWTKTYGGIEDEIGLAVLQTNDEGYILAGYTESYGAGNIDAWLIRIAPDEPASVPGEIIYVPKIHRLYQNYPNPFNPFTRIKYCVNEPGHVLLKIYNIKGQEIQTLIDTYNEKGIYHIDFDAQNISSGLYFYRIQIGEFQDVKKLLKLE